MTLNVAAVAAGHLLSTLARTRSVALRGATINTLILARMPACQRRAANRCAGVGIAPSATANLDRVLAWKLHRGNHYRSASGDVFVHLLFASNLSLMSTVEFDREGLAA